MNSVQPDLTAAGQNLAAQSKNYLRFHLNETVNHSGPKDLCFTVLPDFPPDVVKYFALKQEIVLPKPPGDRRHVKCDAANDIRCDAANVVKCNDTNVTKFLVHVRTASQEKHFEVSQSLGIKLFWSKESCWHDTSTFFYSRKLREVQHVNEGVHSTVTDFEITLASADFPTSKQNLRQFIGLTLDDKLLTTSVRFMDEDMPLLPVNVVTQRWFRHNLKTHSPPPETKQFLSPPPKRLKCHKAEAQEKSTEFSDPHVGTVNLIGIFRDVSISRPMPRESFADHQARKIRDTLLNLVSGLELQGLCSKEISESVISGTSDVTGRLRLLQTILFAPAAFADSRFANYRTRFQDVATLAHLLETETPKYMNEECPEELSGDAMEYLREQIDILDTGVNVLTVEAILLKLQYHVARVKEAAASIYMREQGQRTQTTFSWLFATVSQRMLEYFFFKMSQLADNKSTLQLFEQLIPVVVEFLEDMLFLRLQQILTVHCVTYSPLLQGCNWCNPRYHNIAPFSPLDCSSNGTIPDEYFADWAVELLTDRNLYGGAKLLSPVMHQINISVQQWNLATGMFGWRPVSSSFFSNQQSCSHLTLPSWQQDSSAS